MHVLSRGRDERACVPAVHRRPARATPSSRAWHQAQEPSARCRDDRATHRRHLEPDGLAWKRSRRRTHIRQPVLTAVLAVPPGHRSTPCCAVETPGPASDDQRSRRDAAIAGVHPPHVARPMQQEASRHPTRWPTSSVTSNFPFIFSSFTPRFFTPLTLVDFPGSRRYLIFDYHFYSPTASESLNIFYLFNFRLFT